MATISYNGTNLRSVIDKITNIQRPILPPKDNNLVQVPGRDWPYDFGKNYKKEFEIKLEFVLLADETNTIDDKINNLESLLDYPEAKNLVIGGKTYKAQVNNGINVEILTGRQAARGTITFNCYVLPV